MTLNTYRFNKYFTDDNKKRINYLESISLISKNTKVLKNLWVRYNALKEGVFLTRDSVSEPANNLTLFCLQKKLKNLKNVD